MADDLDLDSVTAFQLAADSSSTSGSWNLLRQRLKESKQSAVAAAINMDPGQFSNVVTGKANLPLPTLIRLLEELDIKLVDAKAQMIETAVFEGMASGLAVLYSKAPHLLLKG